MSSVTFNLDTKRNARIAITAISLTIAILVLMGFAFARSYFPKPSSANISGAQTTPEWANLSPMTNSAPWTAFFRRKSSGQNGRVSENYRLAGTFFEFGASQDTRRAIIDEIKTGRQHIVSEGQNLSDLLVLAISADHILVRAPAGAEEELWLSFRDSRSDASHSGDQSQAATGDDVEGAADSFGGRRVGENRWVFERDKLMKYYTDLMSEPERLVKVFDSLKPVYTDDGKIDGYELEVFGEQAFFESTGLKAGDRVRSVNSIEMSNRRRAEYLISEFVNDRVNVVVMDIERDGKPQKFIYQIR